MKTKLNLFGFIFLVLFVFSCNSQEQPDNFDYGKVENNQYTNTFFKFKMMIPPDWYIQTKDSLVYKVKDQIKDMKLSGNAKNLQTHVQETKASTIQKATLLSLFKYNLDSAVDFNYSLFIVSKNLKNTPETKTGADILNEMISASKKSNVKRNFIGAPKLLKISNKDFYKITAEIEVPGLVDSTVKQTMYASVIKGFCFTIIYSFTTDKQREEINKIIETATFYN